MNVLVMMEFSGVIRDAFIRWGHNAVSCDLLPTERPGPHSQLHCFDFLREYPNWDLMICHPPCTYLTAAGARWRYDARYPDRAEDQAKAIVVVERLWAQDQIPRIALENPVGCIPKLSTLGPCTQIIHPWQYGHRETKKTCLWEKNLNLLTPSDVVGPPPGGPERKEWEKVFRHPRNEDRWKDRSRTFTGVGEAMAVQWGGISCL